MDGGIGYHLSWFLNDFLLDSGFGVSSIPDPSILYTVRHLTVGPRSVSWGWLAFLPQCSLSSKLAKLTWSPGHLSSQFMLEFE